MTSMSFTGLLFSSYRFCHQSDFFLLLLVFYPLCHSNILDCGLLKCCLLTLPCGYKIIREYLLVSRFWSLKESYVKATGEGLNLDLQTIDFITKGKYVCYMASLDV